MAASGLVLAPAEVYSHASLYEVAPNVEAIQIYLATIGSDTVIPMCVLRSDTIASVKMRIQAYKGFYIKQQRLVYAGRELTRDDRLIEEYGVSHGGKLHLVLRVSDLVDVTVKTVDGKEYVFKVEKNQSVRDLKLRISEKEGGLPLDAQRLVLRGQNLEDQRCIDDLSLRDDAAVHLLIRRTAKVQTRYVGKDIELSVTADDFVRSEKDAVADTVEGVRLAQPRYRIPQYQPDYYDSGYRKNQVNILEPAYGILRYQLPDVLVDILEQAKAGLQAGHPPALAAEGSGGAYFLKSAYGVDSVAIFKPVDEEPMAVNNPRGFSVSKRGEGLKRGTRVGEGALREVAAYLLDHPKDGRRSSLRKDPLGFANVPPTMMVRCAHDAFHYSSDSWNFQKKAKMGSLQQFVRAFTSCEDMGSGSFRVEEVHKIAVLDMRLANTDRNGGNILVLRDENNDMRLVPIDHGYCLPEKFEDVTFEWLYWSQAEVPFSSSTLEYIATMDADEDIALLQKHGWALRAACKRVFRVSTMLLKKGAAAGLTPFAIGSMMCREDLNELSPVEEMIAEVGRYMLPSVNDQEFMAALSVVMDRYIEMAK